jgi:hypothetical protein
MKHKIAKPVEGRLVRDPVSMAPVTNAGTLHRSSGYWNRRVKDGDITVEEPKTEKPKNNKP